MIALLKRQLGAYRTVLWFVVLYQAIQAIAGLYLPTLNADIIDKGVAKGDHGYILRMGVVMIGVTLIQVTLDRKSTRLNSSHIPLSRMPSSA